MNKIKLSLVLVMAILGTGILQAQSFKLPKTSGKVIIEVSEAVVEAYNGNEIIVTTYEEKGQEEDSEVFEIRVSRLTGTSSNQNNDSKTKGLRVVNSSGLVDNTGLGVSAKVEGNNIKIAQVGKNPISNLLIKIPKGMPISFAYTKMEGGMVEFKNIESEIEATSQYNEFKLTDVRGAVTMHAVYGGITGVFTKSPTGPISIISVYSDVDLDIPNGLKADVNLSTPYGDVFAAPEFDIVVDRKPSKVAEKNNDKAEKGLTGINDTAVAISTIVSESISNVLEGIKNNLAKTSPNGWLTDDIRGKLNGGGFNLIVKANYGNIYLR